MKKVYTMVALALASGLGAFAAPQVEMAKVANAEAIVAVENVGNGVAVSTPAAKGIAKEIGSVDDLAGMKKWTGILMFGQKELEGTIINGPQAGVIFAEDPRATRITLTNFPSSGLNLRLNVNLAKKEVSFESGAYVGDVNTSEGLKECNIYVRQNNGDIVYDDASGLYKYSQRPSSCERAVGKILDDGTISFDGYTFLAQSPDMVSAGSVYLMLNTANIVFTSTPWNTPVESEYTYVGLGEYKDPFFTPRYSDQSMVPVNKKAEIFTKKDGDNIMVAVKNPYKDVEGTWTNPEDGKTYQFTDFWKEVGMMYEDASENGWILFKVFRSSEFSQYNDPAACIQLVPCGMEEDNSDEEDGSDVQMYYPFNTEGELLYSGGEEALLGQLETWDLIDTEYSKVEDNVIKIRNAYFGQGQAPTAGYWWGHYEGEEFIYADRIVGEVVLPAGWDGNSGISNAMGEVENGPVKYYNLQGVEIAAPVKGQLTIKKQGNKSVKFIAR